MIQLENPTQIIAGGYYKGDCNWNNSYNHSDDCYKLYNITHGELWIESTEGRQYLREGGLYLINGHKLLSYGTDSEFATNWLHFNAQNVMLRNAISQFPLLTTLSKSIIDVIGTLGGDDVFVIDSANFDHFAKLRLQGVLQVILANSFQINYLSISPESEEMRRISPAIEYIHNNLDSTLKLEDLSTACCLSVSHFCKIFKGVMNLTPNQFILRERMNLSSRLIHSGVDIKSIAAKVGFHDDAHFCRVFKRFFGITPTYYRKHISC